MKNIFISFILISFCFFPLYQADASAYQIHFRYDQETKFLTFDESSGVPISVDKDQDVNPLEFASSESAGNYSIAFLFATGEEIIRKNFDPTMKSNTFVLNTPYYSFAKSLAVYRDESNTPILFYDLSQFVMCNENDICEYEKGENMNTCLPDCVGTTVNFSDETKKLLKQNNDVLTDPKTGEVLLRGIAPVAGTSTGGVGGTGGGADAVVLVVGIVVLLLIIGGVVVVIRLRKRNRQYGL